MTTQWQDVAHPAPLLLAFVRSRSSWMVDDYDDIVAAADNIGIDVNVVVYVYVVVVRVEQEPEQVLHESGQQGDYHTSSFPSADSRELSTEPRQSAFLDWEHANRVACRATCQRQTQSLIGTVDALWRVCLRSP